MPITAPACVRFGSGGGVDGPGDAEVGHLHVAVRGDEDVGRLDVAVDHAVAVGEAERRGDLGGDSAGLHRGEPPVGPEDVGQALAVDVLHHDEVGAALATPVVDADDVRVVEVRRGLGLTAEPLHEARVGGVLGEQHLDRDPAVEQPVVGEEDVGHAAPTEAVLDLVAVVEDRASPGATWREQVTDGRPAAGSPSDARRRGRRTVMRRPAGRARRRGPGWRSGRRRCHRCRPSPPASPSRSRRRR